MAYALGIDVGTTFTAAAVWADGRATTLPLGTRSDAVPTVVYLRADGVPLVGDPAEQPALVDPSRVARAFKRRMGDQVGVRVGDRVYAAADLVSEVIAWVVRRATERQGAPPAHV